MTDHEIQQLLQQLTTDPDDASAAADAAPAPDKVNAAIRELIAVVQAPKTTESQLVRITNFLTQRYDLNTKSQSVPIARFLTRRYDLNTKATCRFVEPPFVLVLYGDICARLFRQASRKYSTEVGSMHVNEKLLFFRDELRSFEQERERQKLERSNSEHLVQHFSVAERVYEIAIERGVKGVHRRLGVLLCEYSQFQVEQLRTQRTHVSDDYRKTVKPHQTRYRRGIVALQNAVELEQDLKALNVLMRLQKNQFDPAANTMIAQLSVVTNLNQQLPLIWHAHASTDRRQMLVNTALTRELKELLARNTALPDSDTRNKLTDRNLIQIHFFLGESEFTKATLCDQSDNARKNKNASQHYQRAVQHYASVASGTDAYGEALFQLGRLAQLRYSNGNGMSSEAYLAKAMQNGYTLGTGMDGAPTDGAIVEVPDLLFPNGMDASGSDGDNAVIYAPEAAESSPIRRRLVINWGQVFSSSVNKSRFMGVGMMLPIFVLLSMAINSFLTGDLFTAIASLVGGISMLLASCGYIFKHLRGRSFFSIEGVTMSVVSDDPYAEAPAPNSFLHMLRTLGGGASRGLADYQMLADEPDSAEDAVAAADSVEMVPIFADDDTDSASDLDAHSDKEEITRDPDRAFTAS